MSAATRHRLELAAGAAGVASAGAVAAVTGWLTLVAGVTPHELVETVLAW